MKWFLESVNSETVKFRSYITCRSLSSCHLYTPFWKTSRLKDPMLAQDPFWKTSQGWYMRDPAIRHIFWNLLVCQKQKRSLGPRGDSSDGWLGCIKIIVLLGGFFERGGRAHVGLNENRVEDRTLCWWPTHMLASQKSKRDEERGLLFFFVRTRLRTTLRIYPIVIVLLLSLPKPVGVKSSLFMAGVALGFASSNGWRRVAERLLWILCSWLRMG